MASITTCGFCEVAALSKYINGLPFTSRLRIGNCLRTASKFKVFCIPAVSIILYQILIVQKLIDQYSREGVRVLFFQEYPWQNREAIMTSLFFHSHPATSGRTGFPHPIGQSC